MTLEGRTPAEVAGKGFAANSLVTVTFGGTTITTATTDGEGSFTATFLVRSVRPDPYIVSATDGSGNSDQALFVVQ